MTYTGTVITGSQLLRRKRFWFGLIVSFGFLAFFLARTNFHEISTAFEGADLLLAVAAVPLYFFGFWLRTVRWRFLLRPIADVPIRRLYPVVLIGLMTNNIAPARVGELVRAYLLGERQSMSKTTALGTIAVDRTFDGLTLVAILGIVTIASGADAGVKAIGVVSALLFVAVTTALVTLALSPVRARVWVTRLLHLLPAALAEKAEGLLDAFLEGLRSIRNPWMLLQAAVASVASWLMEATMYYIVGEAFHLNVGFDVYLLVTASANLALSVFASPGGIGPFEVTTREVLVYFDVAGASASAYALALHALLLAPVIIVGLVLVWTTSLSLRDMLGQTPTVPVATTRLE
ncbi:MAG TPA: lysylphosphatidylglycerol synthase transmembrane domain-containing protein [Dehalococcoidia bacterium]|nr:lysylphosphatidylglycerol synthase transmembrane domain-containing protein [Dehalococcoidia bacterium]